MSDCIFCKIVAGQIPAIKVLEDERILAFMDINPINPGHMLVIPRRHFATITDISPDDLTAVFLTAQKLAEALKKSLNPAGLNLIQSNGRAASQMVDHFHLHLVPRWPEDPFSAVMNQWKLKPGDPAAIAQTAEHIRKAI